MQIRWKRLSLIRVKIFKIINLLWRANIPHNRRKIISYNSNNLIVAKTLMSHKVTRLQSKSLYNNKGNNKFKNHKWKRLLRYRKIITMRFNKCQYQQKNKVSKLCLKDNWGNNNNREKVCPTTRVIIIKKISKKFSLVSILKMMGNYFSAVKVAEGSLMQMS